VAQGGSSGSLALWQIFLEPYIEYALLASVHEPRVVVVVLLVVVIAVVVVPLVVVDVVAVVGIVVPPPPSVVVGNRLLHESISKDPITVPATI
jgi:hypothetical protein